MKTHEQHVAEARAQWAAEDIAADAFRDHVKAALGVDIGHLQAKALAAAMDAPAFVQLARQKLAAEALATTAAAPASEEIHGFPGYKVSDLPPLPAGWDNVTFSNDGCPSYQCGLSLICLDYADPRQRHNVVEMGLDKPNARFAVLDLFPSFGEDRGTSAPPAPCEAVVNPDPSVSNLALESEDWAEVVAFVNEREAKRRALAERMAEACEALHLAASAMWKAYDDAGGDGDTSRPVVDMNRIQPPDFSSIIAASLDEWAVSIAPVTRAWRALAEL